MNALYAVPDAPAVEHCATEPMTVDEALGWAPFGLRVLQSLHPDATISVRVHVEIQEARA